MAKTIEAQMDAIFDEYEQLTDEAVEKASRKTGRDAVQKLKNTSPRGRTGDYASGWATRKMGLGIIVYNKKAPGLTHLLEHGHVIKNKFGEYGRAPAHPHIADVEKAANQEFEEEIRRNMQK